MALWSNVETALHDWIARVTGFPTERVVYADQEFAKPTADYVLLRAGQAREQGAYPYVTSKLVGTAPNDVLRVTLQAKQLVTVSVTALTKAAYGSTSALSLAHLIGNSLSLPTQFWAFHVAGFSVLKAGGPFNLSSFVDTAFQGRATLDLTVAYSEEATEDISYIRKVGITDGTVTPPKSFDVSLP